MYKVKKQSEANYVVASDVAGREYAVGPWGDTALLLADLLNRDDNIHYRLKTLEEGAVLQGDVTADLVRRITRLENSQGGT